MSRRSFVVGATAGVAGAAALAGQAAYADAEEAAAQQAQDADPTAPIAPVEPPASWDREADVVVIGSGGGGLNAAARARELGASVILIEKMPVLGGNTAQAGGSIIMGGSRFTDAVEKALPEYPYDRDAWVRWMEEAFHNELDANMLALVGDNMGPAHDWMGDCGVQWYPSSGTTLIPLNYRQQFGVAAAIQGDVVTYMHEYGEGIGVEYMLDTPAEALVMDGGRVVGVKAAGQDGSDIYLHAAKGVIMCAGGFAANKDMLAKYCPNALVNCGNCYVSQTDSGECVRMGQGAGGAIAGLDCYSMFDGGLDYEQFGGEWCTYLYNGANQLVRQPWLTIDRTGARKRYITSGGEDGMSTGALTAQANVQTSSPGGRSYILFDDDYEKSVENFSEVHCRKLIEPDDFEVEKYVPEHFCDWHNGVNDALESGVIATADTLEELAEKLGLEPDVVVKAVEDWNATCEKGEDDALYPYDPAWLVPIVTPPFHGAKVGGIIFKTDCGLVVNTKMQVVDEAGTPIPGLYAGWFTAAASCDNGGNKSSIRYSIGGVSLSYTGGYLCANSLMEQEA